MAGTLIAWVIALTWLSNFTYGALLPIVPALNVETAGLAFTSFALFKVFCLPPAGIISDKLGHLRSLTVALFIQVVSLSVMAAIPSSPWIARILEGVALAQGMVSNISVLRMLCPRQEDFARAIQRVMAIGGLGFILGPLFGFELLRYGAVFPVYCLLALNALFFVVQLGFAIFAPQLEAPAEPASAAITGDATISRDTSLIWMILGFAASKALAQGWQPVLAWWANHDLGLSANLSGLSFILLGIAFTVGAAKQSRHIHWTGIAGVVLLELSLRGLPQLWWLSIVLMGYWYGAYVTIAVARLGWNSPDRIGRFNSRWMLATDLPMALVPLILWQWRAPQPGFERIALAALLLAVAGAGMIYGVSPSVTAPVAATLE